MSYHPNSIQPKSDSDGFVVFGKRFDHEGKKTGRTRNPEAIREALRQAQEYQASILNNLERIANRPLSIREEISGSLDKVPEVSTPHSLPPLETPANPYAHLLNMPKSRAAKTMQDQLQRKASELELQRKYETEMAKIRGSEDFQQRITEMETALRCEKFSPVATAESLAARENLVRLSRDPLVSNDELLEAERLVNDAQLEREGRFLQSQADNLSQAYQEAANAIGTLYEGNQNDGV